MINVGELIISERETKFGFIIDNPLGEDIVIINKKLTTEINGMFCKLMIYDEAAFCIGEYI